MLNLFETISFTANGVFPKLGEKIYIDFENSLKETMYDVEDSYLGFASPDYAYYMARILWINVEIFDEASSTEYLSKLWIIDLISAIGAYTILKEKVAG